MSALSGTPKAAFSGTSKAAAGGLISAAAPKYRRLSTVRAPRKRVALLALSKRASASDLAALSSGGDGPCGPPRGGDRRWSGGGGDGGFGGDAAPGGQRSLAAALVAGAGVALALGQAHPAQAIAAPVLASSDGGDDTLLPLMADDDWLLSSTGLWHTAAAAGSAFTEDEKEMVCPKQYHIREWVFVH